MISTRILCCLIVDCYHQLIVDKLVTNNNNKCFQLHPNHTPAPLALHFFNLITVAVYQYVKSETLMNFFDMNQTNIMVTNNHHALNKL